MLVDAELSADQVKKLASSIYGSSRRILAMLQELADTSRGHSRRREACRLRDVVLAACDSLADAAARPASLWHAMFRPRSNSPSTGRPSSESSRT